MKQMSTIKFPNQVEAYEIVDAVARLEITGKSDIGHTHTRSEITDFAHEHDERYYTEAEIDAKVIELKEYTNSQIDNIPSIDAYTKEQTDTLLTNTANQVKNDLLNGAGDAYDTLKELGELIDDNVDAIEALRVVAANKADKVHTHEISDVVDLQSKLEQLETLASVQPDWNQNNESAVDFIKNRTHWIEVGDRTLVMEEQTVSCRDSNYSMHTAIAPIISGKTYIVTLDGIEYECVAFDGDSSPYLAVQVNENTFTFDYYIDDNRISFGARRITASFIAKIEESNVAYVPLDEKFIPDTIARQVDVQNAVSTKQEKNLIVTFTDNTRKTSTHSSQEIYTAIQNGTTVYFNNGGTNFNYLEGASNVVNFYNCFYNNDVMQADVYEIWGNTITNTHFQSNILKQSNLDSLETELKKLIDEAKEYSDANLEVAQIYTDQQIAAIPTPDVSGQISAHNTSTESHNDIRLALSSLSTQVNNFLDVDDTTKDQLSEVLAMIEANEGTLESLTTSKVNKSDIVNNLTTNDAEKVLSGAQGVVIQGQIDDLDEAKLNKSDAANMYASKSAFLLHEGNTNIHFTAAERTKLENIEAGAQVNTITGVKGHAESTYRTGNVNITKANIGLENVDNTADSEKPVSTAQQTAINTAKAAANAYTDGKITAEIEARDAAIAAAKSQAITEGANSAVNTINTKLANDYYDKEQIDSYVLITTSEIDAIWGYANPTTILKDFNYTANDDDDTYTLTEWKGTTDGVESTECIIPDDSRIIL